MVLPEPTLSWSPDLLAVPVLFLVWIRLTGPLVRTDCIKWGEPFMVRLSYNKQLITCLPDRLLSRFQLRPHILLFTFDCFS